MRNFYQVQLDLNTRNSVCMYMCVYTQTHTHTRVYIYMYVYIHLSQVCVCIFTSPLPWDFNLMLLIKMVKIERGEFYLANSKKMFSDYISTLWWLCNIHRQLNWENKHGVLQSMQRFGHLH